MKNWFYKLWCWVTGRGVDLFKFLAPIVADEAGRMIEILAPAALEIALDLATSKSKGSKKFQIAVDELRARATVAGVNATTSILNTTVQLAVQRLKATGEIQ